MKKMSVAMLVAAAALLLASVSSGAGASVIYTWHPVNTKAPYLPPEGGCGPRPACGELLLEVTDAAFNAGSLNQIFFHTYGEQDGNPDAPIIELFSVSQVLLPQQSVNYFPWFIDANVQFGDYLTGTLDINDGENSYRMSTNDHSVLWTIYGFNSDNPDWGCYYTACSGAVGYWALGSAPSPVPEPDLFAVFGVLAFGLLGADTARCWRRTRHPEPSLAHV